MKTTYLYIGFVVVLLASIVVFRQYAGPASERNASTPEYDAFAQCLSDAGAKFYGAFWCPHCEEQKDMLKNSPKLPYIECSTLDGESQTQVCIDEKIVGYPTWKFADGSELSGTQELTTLGEKTNCVLPTS